MKKTRQLRLIEDSNKEVAKLDSWSNVFTGLGDPNRDTSENTTWRARTPLTYNTLDRLYAQNSLVAKILDRPAWDMTREWIELELPNEDADAETAILDRMLELELPDRMRIGITWGKLYGGAIGVIGADDGSTHDKPLNEAGLKKITKLEIFDRYQLTTQGVIEDLNSPHFGLPEFYVLNANAGKAKKTSTGLRIHHSRVIRFEGVRVPDRLRQETDGWPWSMLDRIFTDIRDFQSSLRYLVNIMKEANIDVFQIENLKDLLRNNRKQEIEDRFRIIAMCKSILGAVIVGGEEKFERRSVVLSGIVELLREFKETLSSAADIPTTLLWGRSPAGLNATGESDINQYYDRIHGDQDVHLGPPLRRIARLISIEQSGTIKRELKPKIVFRSLKQLDEKERSEVYGRNADADVKYIQEGVLQPAEVAMARFGDNRGDIKINEELRREALEMAELIRAAGEEDDAPPSTGEETPPAEGGEAETEDKSKQALTGVQVESFIKIVIELVRTKKLPRENGIVWLEELFSIDRARGERMIPTDPSWFVDEPDPAADAPAEPVETKPVE